ncbi:MAG: hypothetical protein Q9170_002042 [Blastenia crenularia]
MKEGLIVSTPDWILHHLKKYIMPSQIAFWGVMDDIIAYFTLDITGRIGAAIPSVIQITLKFLPQIDLESIVFNEEEGKLSDFKSDTIPVETEHRYTIEQITTRQQELQEKTSTKHYRYAYWEQFVAFYQLDHLPSRPDFLKIPHESPRDRSGKVRPTPHFLEALREVASYIQARKSAKQPIAPTYVSCHESVREGVVNAYWNWLVWIDHDIEGARYTRKARSSMYAH